MNLSSEKGAAGTRFHRKVPEQYLVTVFEASNETLRELYVGTTTHLVEVLTRLFLERPPARVSHWRSTHRISIRCVDYSVAVHDVDDFLEAYAASEALKPWKVIRQDAPQARVA
ncbi:MAG: hypothetical protein HY925_14100 [Elusimicrobia bacterium]|nr:hypothetical protein [Elusimicrobiota bacterium]